MNHLTVKQRKTAYLLGIVVLLLPIVTLGLPAGGKVGGDESAGVGFDQGGVLARMRRKHDLGETNLGRVDPTSSTMNLVLLGMRAVAANLLWMDALENVKTKNWAKLRANVDSIILLQPHFIRVWRFQGWNLAWNVSAAWDAIPDRYYWVKEGIKFFKTGSERNSTNPDLYWEMGRALSQKIGRSDEWQFFRRYFNPDGYRQELENKTVTAEELGDPDREKWKGGPDLELNPQRRDNYLVGKIWYHIANNVEGTSNGVVYRRQHVSDRVLFRNWPARAQFGYVDALHREGKFGDTSRLAWEIAYRNWTSRYDDGAYDAPGFGQELFVTPGGLIRLNAENAEQIKTLIREVEDRDGGGYTVEQKRLWIVNYQGIANYMFWKNLSAVEQTNRMMRAHHDIYHGRNLVMHQGDGTKGGKALRRGLQLFDTILIEHPELRQNDDLVEELMLSILCWRYLHQHIIEVRIPEPPLQWLWEKNNSRIPAVRRLFQRQYRQ